MSLIAEVRQLLADVARLHAAHTPVHIRHGWMSLLFKDLFTNRTPSTRSTCGPDDWLINFPLIFCLFFFTPTLSVKLGIFITLIFDLRHLATDYGAMSAAEAAFGEPPPPRSHLKPPQPPICGGASPRAAAADPGRVMTCSMAPSTPVCDLGRGVLPGGALRGLGPLCPYRLRCPLLYQPARSADT